MLSLSLCPKVITLSGFHCNTFSIVLKFLSVKIKRRGENAQKSTKQLNIWKLALDAQFCLLRVLQLFMAKGFKLLDERSLNVE
jgi:hypothetical protein